MGAVIAGDDGSKQKSVIAASDDSDHIKSLPTRSGLS
jgi:hypothetical protein